MHEAELYDFDGVLLPNVTAFPFDAVAKQFRENPIRYIPPPIEPVSREIEETYLMSVRQAAAYIIRSRSSVSLDMWEYLWNRTADVYGNTGRPNKRPWVNLTARTLKNGHVFSRFKNIYYRPEGVSGIQSKGAAILELSQMYDHVRHYDDDPWVIFGLAKAFPEVEFVLVQDINFGILISHEEMELFPNVTRVAQLKNPDPEQE